MSLVHPIIEPQMALRACKGKFFGTSQEYVALLYSDRVVFRPIDFPEVVGNDSDIIQPPELEITIPQPPMAMGDSEKEVLPIVGGLFFAVGRNHDMLAMQYNQVLLVLSVNVVDQLLQLQGAWGIPKPKEYNHHNNLVKAASAASLVGLVESSSISHNSGLSLVSALPPAVPSPDGTQIFLATRNKGGNLVILILNCFGREAVKHELEYLNILTLGWLSDDCVYFVYLNHKFHKKFQMCRLGSKIKQSGFLGIGRKSMKTSFIPECTVAIALDYVPAVPDLFGCGDLVFKDYVLLGTRAGGYIRVNYKGSGSWEVVPNAKDVAGSVSVGETALIVQKSTRNRNPNHSLGPSNSLGLPNSPGMGSSAMGQNVTPTASNQFTYGVVSDGTVHAIRGDPQVGACLCSHHNIDGDRRFKLKLLNLGNGYILDFKRQPMRIYKVTSRPTARIDAVPCGDPLGDQTPLVTSKETSNFLVKTAQALYTRDPNGDDTHVSKIINNSTRLKLPLDRPGLVKMVRRDAKSLWAVFSHTAVGLSTPSGSHVLPASSTASYFPEIRVLEESTKSATRLKTKAQFQFGSQFANSQHGLGTGHGVGSGNFSRWYMQRLQPIHKNVVLVGLASQRVSHKLQWGEDAANYKRYGQDGPPVEWALFLVVFAGATTKHNPVPPKAHLLLKGSTPDIAPEALACPGTPNQYLLAIYNAEKSSFTSLKKLTVNTVGEFKFGSVPNKVVPYSLSQSLSSTFFTDLHGPLDGVYLAGKIDPNEEGTVHHITNILLVDAIGANEGTAVILEGKTLNQATIWIFDSNGSQFREFMLQDVPESLKPQLYRQEQLIGEHIKKHDMLSVYKMSPLFRARYFSQTSSTEKFRPLSELNAVICEGVGSGVDAEVYLKTPDDGYYAVFRIQNKKLLESLNRLKKTILTKRVGCWLPEPLKQTWLDSFEGSSMVSGTLFSAFWRLDEEQQLELCEEAGVNPDLMHKVRPP